MPVRLKDVAEHAGVSMKTVSNVVNDRPHVSPQMRARVRASVEALGYRPNLAARQLKYGRTGFIGLALPGLEIPYFAELASRISAESTRSGFITLLDLTDADPERERHVVHGMGPQLLDGLIFSPLSIRTEDIASRSDEVPLVLLGERAVPTGFDHVAVESVPAAQAITEHLIDTGRRRIAAMGHIPSVGTASVRLEGYRRAHAARGLDIDPSLIVGVPDYNRISGYLAMNELLDRPHRPDAVFCFNDAMAVGATRACLERGVAIPDDVALAGFDDIPTSRYLTPTLTTISPDLEFLAREAVRLVRRRIEARASGEQVEAEDVAVPWRLAIRESTGGPLTPVATSRPVIPSGPVTTARPGARD